MQPVNLIDISAVFFRYYFSPIPMQLNKSGFDIGSLKATVRWLSQDVFLTSKTIVSFDESFQIGVRHQLDPNYKANRGLPDEHIIYQLDLLKTIAQHMGFIVLGSHEHEADDLIASAIYALPNELCVIYSRDKDLMQLLSERVQMLDFVSEVRWTPELLQKKRGLKPEQVALYLALVGDVSDNIVGVSRIGDKTASGLLAEFNDWPSLLSAAQTPARLTVRGASTIAQNIVSEQKQVEHNLLLTQLKCDIDVELNARPIDDDSVSFLTELFDEVGLLPALNKTLTLLSNP